MVLLCFLIIEKGKYTKKEQKENTQVHYYPQYPRALYTALYTSHNDSTAAVRSTQAATRDRHSHWDDYWVVIP